MPDRPVFTTTRNDEVGEGKSSVKPVGDRTNHNASNAADVHAEGVECLQGGEYARAVESLTRAVALRPSQPAFHVDLGEAYRNLGECVRAAGCCRTALKLRPDFPEALNTLGLCLQGMDRRDEAVESFRHALELRPEMVTAHNNLGVVFQEMGRLDEAIVHFRQAVDLAPALFRVRTNLGLALLDNGQADESLEHLQEAARLQPDLAILHHNLGNALRTLERHVEARAAYLEAMRLDPELPRNELSIGTTLKEEGQFGNALPWFKLAVEREPDDPSLWEQLAGIYTELDEPGEAIPCWERVLALSPRERATTHLGLGGVLQDEGRLIEARDHYLAAAQLQPDSPAPQLHLGGLDQEEGDLEGAEAAFRTALRLQPNASLPHARLATLLRGNLPDADLAALETRLANPYLEPGPRARLLFGLAHVLDARGDFARAAECVTRANALSRESGKNRRDYAPNDHERFVDGLIRAFDANFFARVAGMGAETLRPVFVFGLPRSGTTLVEQVLASHPQVHGAGELRLGRQSFEDVPAALDRPLPPIECIPDLHAEAIRRLAEAHLERLAALDGGRSARIVNKMPDNTLYLGLLGALFPRATFIHCRRDLRDVAVSCWMTDFRSIRWAHAPEHIAARFRDYARLMDHWRSAFPLPVHEVRYEETVADLEGVARRLVTACGLEWDPACLEFHRTRRPVRTASITQVRKPIYTTSVARWKNYEAALGELFRALPRKDDTIS
jgi:tetratricopeptide (TPR) repeat protein